MDLKTARDYWGELGKLAHLSAIFEACQELESSEKDINRDNVALESGVSANNTVSAGIRAYKNAKILSGEEFEAPEVLIVPILHALEEAFAKNKKAHESAIEEQKAIANDIAKDLRRDIEETTKQNAELAQEIKKLTGEKEDLETKNNNLAGDIIKLESEASVAQSVITNLELSVTERDELIVKLQGEIKERTDDKEGEQERTEQKLEAQREKLEAHYEKENNRLVKILDTAESKLKTEIENNTKLNIKVEKRAETIKDLKQELRIASNDIKDKNERLEQLEPANEKLTRKVEELTIELRSKSEQTKQLLESALDANDVADIIRKTVETMKVSESDAKKASKGTKGAK